MGWYNKLSQGFSQVSDLFSKVDVGSNHNTELNKTNEVSFWSGIFGDKNAVTPSFNNLNGGLNNTAEKIQLSNDDIKATLLRQADKQTSAPIIKPPQIRSSPQDEPKSGYKSYELSIAIPAGQETLSYAQLQNAVIKKVFDQNKVQYSRASIEEIADKEKLDFSPGYDYATGKAIYNEKDCLWANQKPQTAMINGTEQRVLRFVVTPEVQQTIMGDKALSETIKASGKKTFAELNINERMQMAMQMSYDKHYLPHDVQEALKDFDPKQLMAGMVVAGGVMYAATKAGAAKAIPFVGAGVTLTQITYYYAHADAFLAECARAKSLEELDEAAKDFSVLVKQGGIDLTLTLATAGASKLGKVSRAGGELVGLVEDGVKATTAKLSKWNEEIVAGMRSTFGEDLAVETNAAIKTIDGELAQNLEMRAKQVLSGAKEAEELSGVITGSFFGKTEQQILKHAPKEWKKLPTDRGNGWKLVDENGVERVRFMRPSKENVPKFDRMKDGYWRRQDANKNYLDEYGNIVRESDPQFQDKTHIWYSGVKR